MKPEFVVDRELIEQLLVIVFGPSAQYQAHDDDLYTIQVHTSLGKYRFVVSNEMLFNALNNKLTQQEADQVRQQVLLADSDPVKIVSSKQMVGQSEPIKTKTEMPDKGQGCLGGVLLFLLLISLFLI